MLELDDDDTIPTGNSEILAELTATLAALPLVAVEWAAATTPGVRRRVNEDAWGQDRGTFAIADGMGGRGGGAMAARLAIDRFFARLRAADDHPDWRAIVHAVNADVVTAGEREGLDRVGTTLLAAVVAGPVVTLVHLGDSRAYRLTRQPSAPAGAPLRLDVLTHDHTVRAELLAAGLDVGEYRQRGVALHGLTSFIGLDQVSLRVDVLAVPVRAGDRILLCSDGVHRQLDDEQLREALAAAECRDAARHLVMLADRVGGRDNATALVLEIGTGPGSGR